MRRLQLRIILIIIRVMTMKLCSRRILAFAAAVAVLGLSPTLWADDPPPQIKWVNGHFEPAAFNVVAGKPFKIQVTNQGASVIEFESFELNRERVVQPGETITVNLPKLDPGQYHFFDDFHHEVAQGTITAQ
jgi:cupredoxin-like protein